MMYIARTQSEKDIIAQAYEFEIKAIEEDDSSRNPWFDEIMGWKDGKAVWSAIDEAVAMAYCL